MITMSIHDFYTVWVRGNTLSRERMGKPARCYGGTALKRRATITVRPVEQGFGRAIFEAVDITGNFMVGAYRSYRWGRYNETRPRRDFLDLLFECLGWDMTNRKNFSEKYREVIHEISIESGTDGIRYQELPKRQIILFPYKQVRFFAAG